MTEIVKAKPPDGTMMNPIEVKATWDQQCGHPIAVATCPRCFKLVALADSGGDSQRHKGICSNCHVFLLMVTAGTKPANPGPFEVKQQP